MKRLAIVIAFIAVGAAAEPLYVTVPVNPSADDFAQAAVVIKSAYPKPVILDLSAKHITRLDPAFFVGLVNVQELYLHNNQLEDIPPTIMDLQYLMILDCSSNRLRELPAQLGQLENLTMLNAADNQIEHLPNELSHLSRLRLLSLRKNKLHAAPSFLGKLYSLQLLSLAENALQAFTAPVPALTRVRLLDLSFNLLSHITSAALPSQLRVLLLNNNRLHVLSGDACKETIALLDITGNATVYIEGNLPAPEELKLPGIPFEELNIFAQTD